MVALLNFAVGLAMPLLAFANQHGASVHVHRHKDIAARVSGDMQIHKRFSGTRWTWYDVGLGACGKYNVPSDFIVALNSAQYGGGYPGPQCFKSITLSFGGKTANAVIMDECPSCPYGGLDLSKSLFQHFADLGVGVLSGEWHFNDGSSEPKPDPPKPKTTTTKAKPKPTPTSTPPPPPPPPTTTSTTRRRTSTTRTPEPTTSSTSEPPPPPSTTSEARSSSSSSAEPSSSSASSSAALPSVDVSSGPVPGLAAPSGVVDEPTSSQPQIVLRVNQIAIGLGGLTASCANTNSN